MPDLTSSSRSATASEAEESIVNLRPTPAHGTLEEADGRTANIQPFLGSAPGNRFWSGSGDSSLIILRVSTGETERRVGVQRGWFPEGAPPAEGEPLRAPPVPRTFGIRDMGSDRVLLITRVAPIDWAPTEGPMVMNMVEHDWSATFDTVVEVVDSSSGTVLARVRRPELFGAVNGSDRHLFSVSEDSMGHVIVSIWRVEFRIVG